MEIVQRVEELDCHNLNMNAKGYTSMKYYIGGICLLFVHGSIILIAVRSYGNEQTYQSTVISGWTGSTYTDNGNHCYQDC